MPICADGHPTRSTDYCDVCGSVLTAAPTELRVCPHCSAPASGRFCETCGHDSALPLPTGPPPPDVPATAVWVARVFADREFYTRVQARKGPDAERVAFPDFYPERRITLRGTEFLIGKRSTSQGIVPAIDLGIAPADLGVSRAHALIRLDPHGALTITDLGSTNGTSLDGAETPIPPQQPVPLRDGSRVHVGGWTTIAITGESQPLSPLEP